MKKSNVVELTQNDFKESGFINALSSTLRRFTSSIGFGISPDGKRDYNELYGYGTTLSYADFYGMYRRGGIAHTVVSKVAKACWSELPKIKVGETEILEKELLALKKVGFFNAMERADILNRIGNFSVLLVGVPDGQDLNLPIGSAKNIDDLYFNPYNYQGITILSWDEEPTSKRFGLPVLYQLEITSFGEQAKNVRPKSVVVHFSRLVHLAEGALDSSLEGCSSLEAPWNALTDKDKVRGGAGEAYFKNARQQRALEADKDAKLDPNTSASQTLKDNIEAYDNGWETTLRLQNMTAKHLPVNMISPRDTFDVIVEEISGQTGIPIRILTGKGGGQVTGREDRASWNALIHDRRLSECDGYLIQALMILSAVGMINLPDDFEVEWPPQTALSEFEESEISSKRADTLDKAVKLMGQPVGDEMDKSDVMEYLKIDGIEIDEAAIEDKETEALAAAEALAASKSNPDDFE